MNTYRFFLLLGILSFCSFGYVHAQSSAVIPAEFQKKKMPMENQIGCPTAKAQNFLPTEHFLSQFLEKLVQSISITNIVSVDEPRTVVAPKPICPPTKPENI